MQLVKCKDTKVYLYYIYESNTRKMFIIHKDDEL